MANYLRYDTATGIGLISGGTNMITVNVTKGIGIGTTSPAAKLDVNGNVHLKGLSVNQVTKTSNYNLATTDDTVLGDSTNGKFTLTLPNATGIAGKIFDIKKIDSSTKAVTIATTSSQTIDGKTKLGLSNQYRSEEHTSELQSR